MKLDCRLFRPPRGRFFVQRMAVNAEIHHWSQCRVSFCGVLSHKWEPCHLISLRLGDHWERGAGGPKRTVSSGRDGTAVLKNSQQLWLPAQDQASHHSSGEGLTSPCSSWGLRGRETWSSLRLWLLVGQPCITDGGTNWTLGYFSRRVTKLGVGLDLGRIGKVGVRMIKFTVCIYKMLKNKNI